MSVIGGYFKGQWNVLTNQRQSNLPNIRQDETDCHFLAFLYKK